MFGGKKRLIEAVLLENAANKGAGNNASKVTSVKARLEACIWKIVNMFRSNEVNFYTQLRTVMDMFASKKIDHGYAAGTFPTKVQDAKLQYSAESKYFYLFLWLILFFSFSHILFTGRLGKNANEEVNNLLDDDGDDNYFIDGGDDFDNSKPAAKLSDKPLSMASKEPQGGVAKETTWVPVFFMAEWQKFYSNSHMLTVVILLMSGVAYDSASRIHVAVKDGGTTMVVQCRLPDILCEDGLFRLHSDEGLFNQRQQLPFEGEGIM